MPTIKSSADLRNNYNEISTFCHTYPEPVFITKNGKVVAKLTNPHQDRVEVAKSLFGILPKDADFKDARKERLGTK